MMWGHYVEYGDIIVGMRKLWLMGAHADGRCAREHCVGCVNIVGISSSAVWRCKGYEL